MGKQDQELRLVSRALLERDISVAISRGVQDDWFHNATNRHAWKFLRSHWDKYGEVPSAKLFRENLPEFRLIKVADSLEVLVDQLVSAHRRTAVYDTMTTATELLATDDDFEGAAQVLTSGLSKLSLLGTSTTSDVELTDDPLARLDAYDAFEARPDGLLGIPTGFPTIDAATAGLQPGQLVTIVALPKAGKSVLAMQVGINAHMQGHPVMFQSFEMSNAEQQSRHDAMRAHISHSRLTRGTLHRHERVKYEKMLTALDEMDPENRFTLTDSVTGLTVASILAKAAALRPELLIVDGVYLMLDEATGESNSPKALTNITRALKRGAQRLEIPIIQTTQVLGWKMQKGSSRVSADAIGYSSSFYQDSDVILGLERVMETEGGKEAKEREDTRVLRIVGSRNTGPAETDLDWLWDTGTFAEATTAEDPAA